MSQSELERHAEDHPKEAERLLTERPGLINNVIKAGAHATLAVYYATQAQRSSYVGHSELRPVSSGAAP